MSFRFFFEFKADTYAGITRQGVSGSMGYINLHLMLNSKKAWLPAMCGGFYTAKLLDEPGNLVLLFGRANFFELCRRCAF